MLKLLLAAWLILGITVTVVLARIFKPQKKLPPCETCDNLSSKALDGCYECKYFHHRPMSTPLEYCKDYKPRERKDKNHAEM